MLPGYPWRLIFGMEKFSKCSEKEKKKHSLKPGFTDRAWIKQGVVLVK